MIVTERYELAIDCIILSVNLYDKSFRENSPFFVLGRQKKDERWKPDMHLDDMHVGKAAMPASKLTHYFPKKPCLHEESFEYTGNAKNYSNALLLLKFHRCPPLFSEEMKEFLEYAHFVRYDPKSKRSSIVRTSPIPLTSSMKNFIRLHMVDMIVYNKKSECQQWPLVAELMMESELRNEVTRYELALPVTWDDRKDMRLSISRCDRPTNLILSLTRPHLT